MTSTRPLHLLIAYVALLAPLSAHAAQPTISPQEINNFLKKCANIDVPPDVQEHLQGVSIRGLTPARYIVGDSGEGSMWGFEFDISLAEFKQKAPELAKRVNMPIPADEREYTSALYRSIQVLDPAGPVRLVCRTETSEGGDEP